MRMSARRPLALALALGLTLGLVAAPLAVAPASAAEQLAAPTVEAVDTQSAALSWDPIDTAHDYAIVEYAPSGDEAARVSVLSDAEQTSAVAIASDDGRVRARVTLGQDAEVELAVRGLDAEGQVLAETDRTEPVRAAAPDDPVTDEEPDGTEPDDATPDDTTPDDTEPDGTEPDGTEPGATEPEATGAADAAQDDTQQSLADDSATTGSRSTATADTDPVEVTDVLFDWGINNETHGGAYFGGCNFVSAGIAGDTGSPRLWQESDGFYSSQDGNTAIVKPTADGAGLTQPGWATKCQTPAGATVNGKTTNATDSHTQTRVQIAGGTGTIDTAAGTARIAWDGSFTVAYYGGLTYWSASDPVLEVRADGTGTVTATLSGYGADMDDLSVWHRLQPRDVVIADLSGVELTAAGLTAAPDYLGVDVPADIAGRNPQAPLTADNAAWWGSFPAEFLRFQQLTGQNSYWFTTEGGANSIQPRKVALPLTVTVGAAGPAKTAPIIVQQPASVTAAAGAKATFTVAATGSALSYQWQSSTVSTTWRDIAGATGTEYSVTASTALHGTRYRVVVTGAAGEVHSDAATLTVTASSPGDDDDDPGDDGDSGGEGDDVLEVTDVLFDWGINNETHGGAYFGGCNFVSAGIAGDTGSPRLWSQTDGFYRAADGNTTIVKPAADGAGLVQPTWATKCQTPAGATVNGKATNAADSYTQTRVQIAGGTGTVNLAENTADIRWDGSFTVAYYGGMTYWSATNPRLTIDADGTGTVTAILSGYGTDMDDMSIWQPIAGRTVTIAELREVEVTPEGLIVTPEFVGVGIPSEIAGRNPQAFRTTVNESWWGAFPADFLRFQELTGQNSYWYTTEGGANSIQPRKATLPLTVEIGAATPAPVRPAIVSHPSSVTVQPRATASFTVVASGRPLQYQWQRDSGDGWHDIAEATTPSYFVDATAALDGTRYRVVVSNDLGRATSRAATLTVTTRTGGDPDAGDDEDDPVTEATGALFDWGINNETHGGAYFGGCNFVSAGIAGDSGSARLWSQADGFYRTVEGNTTIVRPTSDGSGLGRPTWATRCDTPEGTSVNGKTTSAADSYTQTRVRITGGTGTIDAEHNTAELSWQGSFTVAYYGGMTYWSASDPHLVVDSDGTGTVTVTVSGYGSDMDDMSKWNRLTPRKVVIATLSDVEVTEKGFVVTPDYLGVDIPADIAGRNDQPARTSTNSSWWGAFPADFLRFQTETGQSSYWYTTAGSAGTIQPRKVPLPLTVCATSDCTVATQEATSGPGTITLSQNVLRPPGALIRPVAATPSGLPASGVAEHVIITRTAAAAVADDEIAEQLVIAAAALVAALGLLVLITGLGGGLVVSGALLPRAPARPGGS